MPYNSSIRTILQKVTPYSGIGRLRPDLVDQNLSEIYDVKSYNEIPEGIEKIAYYCGVLNTIDRGTNAGGWHPGVTFLPGPNTFPIDGTGLKIAVVGPPVEGVLPYVLYQLNNPQERVLVPVPSEIPELNYRPRQNTIQLYNEEAVVGVGVAVTATYYLAKLAATWLTAETQESAIGAY